MTIRLAFAGAGYIANIQAQAALSQPDVELVAVVEKFTSKSKTFADKFGVNCCFTSVEELLARGGVDALVIGTPNFLHAPQALAALEHGIHVLVEKPMAMNAGEAEEMLKASRKTGAVLMVAHCWRFDEEVLWLKKQSARLGQIIRTKGYGVHVNWGPAGWFTQKLLAGGGALADMGIHAIDTARFLLGDPQPVSVYARIGTYYKDLAVDDTGVIFINWEGGAVSYIESGWWQPYADGPEACTQLYGTKGFGQVFPTFIQDKRGKRKEAGTPYPRPDQVSQGMYESQMAYFLDCIRTGMNPVPGGEEGLINMKIVDAAYKSASSGKVEKIKA
jgi:predicted dehydrogenase